MRKERIVILSVILFALVIISAWVAWGNTALMVNEVAIKSDKLPQSFSGYRIAQISDLHNAELGKDNAKLVEKLKECNPDIIVFTGDLIDSYRTDIDISIAFAEKAARIAPCYFVAGNHEARSSEYNELIERLELAGVTVLQNELVELERGADTITLLGVRDTSFEADAVNYALSELMEVSDGYTVLLSHRPEMFDIYASNEVDLVLSGHAHGGQLRLPFVGGIIAPGQGLFPTYDAGLYTKNDTNMIVSRGIGNSIIPFRVNNRPEIVVAELRK